MNSFYEQNSSKNSVKLIQQEIELCFDGKEELSL